MLLCILALVSNSHLTPEEQNGGIDGPNLAPLVEAWRAAFRAVPKGHQIQEIHFDMSCGQAIELRQIVRLLQHVSTLVNMKTERRVRCGVGGSGEERRVWLEGSLVGG